MSKAGLEALRARVYDDLDMARRLALIEPQRFVDEAAHLAADHGFEVEPKELHEAIAHGRAAWMLRWIL